MGELCIVLEATRVDALCRASDDPILVEKVPITVVFSELVLSKVDV